MYDNVQESERTTCDLAVTVCRLGKISGRILRPVLRLSYFKAVFLLGRVTDIALVQSSHANNTSFECEALCTHMKLALL